MRATLSLRTLWAGEPPRVLTTVSKRNRKPLSCLFNSRTLVSQAFQSASPRDSFFSVFTIKCMLVVGNLGDTGKSR